MMTTNLAVADLRILVLDDDPVQLAIMSATMENLRVSQGIYTNDPERALAQVELEATDLVFLDLNMPKVNGLEFIRSLHSIQYCGALVLISAHDQRILESSKDLALSYGLNVIDIIQKPAMPETLKSTLQKSRRLSQTRATPRLAAAQDRLTVEDIESELAGRTNCLELAYQPKYDMAKNSICGYEILSRWRRGASLLAPALFIPLAQESGLIHELSMQIYRKALRTHRRLCDAGYELDLAINFPIATLTQQGIVERMLQDANTHGARHSLITIEITEDQIYGSIQDYLEKLMQLIFNGIKLSIDDFGTGVSSLMQVKAVPFAELKVDRLFVHGACRDKRSAALFESSVRLAKQLGMKVVAEGGETQEDWDFAKRLGCDYFQGFYKAKPVPFDALLELLIWEQKGTESIHPRTEGLCRVK